MTRKKVKLNLIPNHVARKATFKKRKKGFLKKCHELKTLCDVDVCSIIYSPYESQPVVWPNPLEARRVVSRYRSLPETEKTKKMYGQDGMLQKRLDQAVDQLKKKRKELREMELTQVMNGCLEGWMSVDNIASIQYLTDLKFHIEQKQKENQRRLETLKMKRPPQQTPHQMPPTPPMQHAENEIVMPTTSILPPLPEQEQPLFLPIHYPVNSNDLFYSMNYDQGDVWQSDVFALNGAFTDGGCSTGDEQLMMMFHNDNISRGNNVNPFLFSSLYN